MKSAFAKSAAMLIFSAACLTSPAPAAISIYIIDWAPHPDGPWSSSWEGLQRIPPTEAPNVTVAVPMFFRAKAIGFDP